MLYLFGKNKNKNMKKVFISGTYDILHAGHIQFFKEARELGDFLVVSFCSDKNLMLYKNRKSAMPEDNKKIILESIRFIDKVIVGNDDGGIWDFVPAFFEEKPDILAITTDDKFIEEKRKFCKKNRVKLVILSKTLPMATSTCTSSIIKNIKDY